MQINTQEKSVMIAGGEWWWWILDARGLDSDDADADGDDSDSKVCNEGCMLMESLSAELDWLAPWQTWVLPKYLLRPEGVVTELVLSYGDGGGGGGGGII